MLHFTKVSGRMIADLVALVIFWINALPPSPYMGGNLSPIQIITGLTIDYKNHCHLKLGYYTQVHESHDNTIQEITTRDIALRPTGNTQGAYFFMSLTTGRILNHQSFNPLPLPQ